MAFWRSMRFISWSETGVWSGSFFGPEAFLAGFSASELVPPPSFSFSAPSALSRLSWGSIWSSQVLCFSATYLPVESSLPTSYRLPLRSSTRSKPLNTGSLMRIWSREPPRGRMIAPMGRLNRRTPAGVRT